MNLASLWESQKEALGKMHNGCILAGGVGSGKSRTAIAYWKTRSGCDDVVVITTAMKRDSAEWQKDFAALGLYSDSDRKHIVIDSWNRIKEHEAVKGVLFIFDEQRLVGKGAWTKSFLKIARQNQWILLSGTPGDVWMDYVPVFIANGFYKNRTEFESRHVIYSRFTKYPKVDRYIGERVLDSHRRRVLVEMPVERKTVRHVVPIFCNWNKSLYDTGTRDRFDYTKDEPMRNASALCHFQRRVVNSDPSRANAMLDIADRHQRIIVFYSFNYELDILRRIGETLGRTVFERNGSRHDTIDESLDSWLYLVQYASGSEAWNCVSTNVVVFYSRVYSWKVLEQARGRIDRMNTPFKDLYYYELISRSSIDQAIGKAVALKQNFNERAYTKDIIPELVVDG